MNRKEQVVKVLVIAGILLLLLVQGIVIPNRNARQEVYLAAQDDSLTHDTASVAKYESAYMGDSSNIANLFHHLPLQSISKKFQLDSENLKATVFYEVADWEIGEAKMKRDLLYNSVVAMGLIQNLQVIRYEFSGSAFEFSRAALVEELDAELADLLASEEWKTDFQEQLADEKFVNEFY